MATVERIIIITHSTNTRDLEKIRTHREMKITSEEIGQMGRQRAGTRQSHIRFPVRRDRWITPQTPARHQIQKTLLTNNLIIRSIDDNDS